MHSLVDIIAGLILGLGILAIWLSVSDYIDNFVVSGQNGTESNSLLHYLLVHQLMSGNNSQAFWFQLELMITMI